MGRKKILKNKKVEFAEGKTLYERQSRYIFGEPTRIFLKSTRGVRNYPPAIKERDWLIDIGIEQLHKCPFCGKISKYVNSTPFSLNDQLNMWKVIFDVKVLPKEKLKQINIFKKLMERCLAQLQLDDLYD